MWYHHHFFRYSIILMIGLVIIWLVGELDFFFRFWLRIIVALFTPVFLAGFFYYLFRPVLHWLKPKVKLPTTIIILLLFLIVNSLIGLFVYLSGDLVSEQSQKLMSNFPKLMNNARDEATDFIVHNNFKLADNFQQQIITSVRQLFPAIINNLAAIISSLTGLTTLLITVPFILFYFLRDDSKFLTGLTERIPEKYRKEVICTLKEADQTLLTYITGQVLLALIMGVLFYLGYLVIGVPYQLILALLVMLTSFIPTFGILIGILPAILIGISHSWTLVLKVFIVFIIINLLRKIIAPNLVGKRLQLHPITIIFIFLIAGSILGFTGILIGVPVYAVSKEVIEGLYRSYNIWKQPETEKTSQ